MFLARSLVGVLINDMESSENGLLKKMKAANMNEEMISRIFGDLVMAAGDTVRIII